MPRLERALTHKTRANHLRKRAALGGHLWLDQGESPALVFRAHGVLQRRYELRLDLEKIRTTSNWTIELKDGSTERFVVAGGTGLLTALETARTQLQPGPSPVVDPGNDVRPTRLENHLWYGSHSDLDWRDRKQAQSWGMDADTYVANFLEHDKD